MALWPFDRNLSLIIVASLCAGNGFGAYPQYVSVTDVESKETLRILAVSQRKMTFTAPPSDGFSSRTFSLSISNATQNLTISYSEAATVKVESIVGDYPIIDSHLMLPATSAAALTILGSGFVSTIAAEVNALDLDRF